MSTRKAAHERYAQPGTGPTDEDLHHEVELTRQELGDTVVALVHKMDVKARMRDAAHRRAAQLQGALSTAAGRTNNVARTVRRHPVAFAGGAVSAISAVLLVIFIRLRR